MTGHRGVCPDHLPRLESALRALFDELRQQYRDSDLVLLSPLAAGADRAAARVALEAGIRLAVPMPMKRELYARDFDTAADRDEFEALAAQAWACYELPLLPGATPDAIRVPGAARDREYAKLGAYVAAHSQVFVALWDGGEPRDDLIGGTAQIVRFRLTGRQHGLANPSGRPARTSGATVEHILTPRGDHGESGAAGSRRTLTPADRSPDSHARLLQRLDECNGDARRLSRDLADAMELSKAQILHSGRGGTVETLAVLPAACQPVLEQYAAADALSVHFGRRTLAASRRIFLSVFAGAVLINLHTFYYHAFFAKVETASLTGRLTALPWFLICFLALSMFTAIALHRRAIRGEYQNKHQDYRALAEALRVQFFWTAAGIGESVVHRYLRRHRSDLEWIRSALFSSAVLTHAAGAGDGGPPAARLDFVVERWIRDQRRYYGSRAVREQRTLHKEERISGLLLKLSVGLTLLLAILLCAPLLYPSPVLDHLHHLLEMPGVAGTFEFLMVVSAVAAGLLVAYGDQLARAEHVREFTRMGELFEAAEQEIVELRKSGRDAAAADVLLELGTEALDESGDWLILHRERPLEMPHTG